MGFSSIFKKKDKEGRDSETNASSNPYAASTAAASDPYAIDTNKHEKYGSKPSPYEQAKHTYAPSQSTARSPPPAYGSERYGAGDGYGSNRYDTGNSYGGGQSSSARGAGGYGGLGREEPDDSQRDALFGGAPSRQAKKQTGPPPANGQPEGGYEAGPPQPSYGAYGDRQLTAEEEEEEDILATKQQMREMKLQDVASSSNALRIAAQAEETGRATLARLGAQGERIHNTEKNLDLAANHNRIAEEKARELKRVNASMFAGMAPNNPFNSASRKAARDAEILEKHRVERAERDITRKNALQSNSRMESTFRELQPGQDGYRAKVPSKATLAERAKYQFEADSEDDEMESEIERNMEALHGAAGRLNQLAQATGKEVDEQNKHIDRIIEKSDRVDDQIVMNRARLDRIH